MTRNELRKRGRGSGCARLALIGLGLASIGAAGYMLSTREPAPKIVSISPGTMKPLGTVSDRFLSYNVEMVEITGGRFWRPYKDGKRKGDDRYEYRPPLDLSHPRLVKLASALAPAYMRVSGTWANATYLDLDNDSGGKAPPGFDTVLTGEQWRDAVEFARATDAQIVTSFATSPGVRDNTGAWQPTEARKLIALTKSLGEEIAAAEFANEPETADLMQAPKGYTEADYRRDYGRWYEFMRETSPSTLLLAPGVAELGPLTQFLRRWTSGMRIFDRDELIATGRHRPDAVSFHFYGGGSQRCGVIPVIGYARNDALDRRWLDLIDGAITTTAALRDKVASGVPLWLTETGETACGGNPWAATFTDVFRFTNQLALSARRGVQVYIHNTLAASDYALLDEETHAPRPNYWAAWLWRNFMGTRVVDAGKATSGVHLYAHCLRGHPGGVAVLAINRDERASRSLRVPGDGELFELRQGSTPAQAVLNGRVLKLDSKDNLPTLRGVPVAAGSLKIAPASVNYLAFRAAGNSACG